MHIHFYCMKKHRSPFSTKYKTTQVWLNDRIYILKTHKNHLLTRLFQLIISLSCVSPAAQRVNSGKPWCNSTDLWAEHEWTRIINKEEIVNNTDETGFAWLWRKFMLHLSHVLWAVGIYHDEDFCLSSSAGGRAVTRAPSPERGMLGDAVPAGLCQWHTDRQPAPEDYSSSSQDESRTRR